MSVFQAARSAGLVWSLAALMGGPLAAQAANRTVAYVGESGYGQNLAYLVEWRSGGTRANLVANAGLASGAVSTLGLNQVITLDVPFSEVGLGDPTTCDGLQPDVRFDTLRIGIRQRSGNANKGLSAVSTAGSATTLTGCEAGKVVAWGEISDTSGLNALHRAMSARAPVDDLVVGAKLTGMSVQGSTVVEQPGVDIGIFQAGGLLQMALAGTTVPYTLGADGWFVLDLGAAGQRGYLRLTAADGRGIEQWLAADMAGGVPQRVQSALMLKPVDGTAWGTVAETSRMWESGLFTKTTNPFFVYLYKDGTGERVQKSLVDGSETRTPINAWLIDTGIVSQDRVLGNGTIRRRLWVPQLRLGKSMGVLEAEKAINPDGSSQWVILPRVNNYVDTGKAVKPAQRVLAGR